MPVFTWFLLPAHCLLVYLHIFPSTLGSSMKSQPYPAFAFSLSLPITYFSSRVSSLLSFKLKEGEDELWWD